MGNLQMLLTETVDGIMTITINREKALNALNQKTLEELQNTMLEVDSDESIRGVIITGQGEKAFVAGADIKEFEQVTEVTARRFAERGQEIFELFERATKPVIAVVNGYALGGGCELAMACHMRIATSNAVFGQPEVNLGIIPGYGGTQRLAQLVGKGKAMELITTGAMIDAKQSLKYGLVNYLEESKEKAMAKAQELMGLIKQKAPLAVGISIDCINAVYTKGENGYQTEANAFARLCGTEDFKEGTKAFIEKRKPNFTGK
ncbi:MAG: enoyl-CoA hydratase/isomerase family protein [Reichenbachiella sp.]